MSGTIEGGSTSKKSIPDWNSTQNLHDRMTPIEQAYLSLISTLKKQKDDLTKLASLCHKTLKQTNDTMSAAQAMLESLVLQNCEDARVADGTIVRQRITGSLPCIGLPTMHQLPKPPTGESILSEILLGDVPSDEDVCSSTVSHLINESAGPTRPTTDCESSNTIPNHTSPSEGPNTDSKSLKKIDSYPPSSTTTTTTTTTARLKNRRTLKSQSFRILKAAELDPTFRKVLESRMSLSGNTLRSLAWAGDVVSILGDVKLPPLPMSAHTSEVTIRSLLCNELLKKTSLLGRDDHLFVDVLTRRKPKTASHQDPLEWSVRAEIISAEHDLFETMELPLDSNNCRDNISKVLDWCENVISQYGLKNMSGEHTDEKWNGDFSDFRLEVETSASSASSTTLSSPSSSGSSQTTSPVSSSPSTNRPAAIAGTPLVRYVRLSSTRKLEACEARMLQRLAEANSKMINEYKGILSTYGMWKGELILDNTTLKRNSYQCALQQAKYQKAQLKVFNWMIDKCRRHHAPSFLYRLRLGSYLVTLHPCTGDLGPSAGTKRRRVAGIV